jgi:7,8-dihydropterin-6-yl-methyl-4-(beta-D-ribofuranosyl)aminobenzene 5'-phosphate synthase
MPLFLLPLLHPLIEKNPYFCKYIGLERQALQNSRLERIEAPREILENVFLLADIGNKHALPEGNTFLLEKTENGLQRDRFVHELIMVIREPDGLVLFTGCGHRGIANMMDTVLRHFGGERLKGIVGGFHLALQPGKPSMAGSREDIIALARQCRAAGVDKVLTGHCTGDRACAIFKEELGERAGRLSTGFRCSL